MGHPLASVDRIKNSDSIFTLNGRMWVTASTNTAIFHIPSRANKCPSCAAGDQNARPLPWMQISRQPLYVTYLLHLCARWTPIIGFVTAAPILVGHTRPKRCISSLCSLMCLRTYVILMIGARAPPIAQFANSLKLLHVEEENWPATPLLEDEPIDWLINTKLVVWRRAKLIKSSCTMSHPYFVTLLGAVNIFLIRPLLIIYYNFLKLDPMTQSKRRKGHIILLSLYWQVIKCAFFRDQMPSFSSILKKTRPNHYHLLYQFNPTRSCINKIFLKYQKINHFFLSDW